MDIQSRIDELEKRAAESALIAGLATDPEARMYNSGLARQLYDLIGRLREASQPPVST